MLEQFIMSFLAAAGFGVLFNSPKNTLIQCGLIGMLGWVLYFALVSAGADDVPATLAGALLVGLLSQLCARLFRTPIIIFNVSGIIPLVPGGLAYDAMRNFVENDYNLAIELSTRVSLIAGAIATGLVFSEVINHIVRKALSKSVAAGE